MPLMPLPKLSSVSLVRPDMGPLPGTGGTGYQTIQPGGTAPTLFQGQQPVSMFGSRSGAPLPTGSMPNGQPVPLPAPTYEPTVPGEEGFGPGVPVPNQPVDPYYDPSNPESPGVPQPTQFPGAPPTPPMAGPSPEGAGPQSPTGFTPIDVPHPVLYPTGPYEPGVPGGDEYVSPFGPGNDLRYQYINPTGSERLTGMAGQSDAARSGVSGFEGFAPFRDVNAPDNFTPQGDTQNVRFQTLDALNRLNSGPTRTQLALDAFKSIDEATADERNRGIRQIGQSAAALGRLNSGMVTTDLGNLEERLQTNRDRTLRDLAVQTGSQEFGDQLSRLGATGQVGDQFYGQDVSQAGIDAALRGEARDERGTERNFEAQDLAARQSVLGQLSGLEGEQFNREATMRGEIRGERGYQQGVAQQAQEDAIRQRLLEEQLLNDAFNRQYQRANLSLGLAGQAGDQSAADQAAVNDYLEQLAYLDVLRRRNQPGSPPTDASGGGLG